MKHCSCLFHCMAGDVDGKEKEKSRIRAVHMDSLRGMLGIRRMNRVPNGQIREMRGVTKVVNEMIDESVHRRLAILKERGMI